MQVECKVYEKSSFGTMTTAELEALFTGYSYAPQFVDGPDYDTAMYTALETAYVRVRAIQQQARGLQRPERPHWPLLIVRTPKGWTGIKDIDDKAVEGSFRLRHRPRYAILRRVLCGLTRDRCLLALQKGCGWL
jgi:xylulose-5-phosphate/fructose-6-phosphate phosphoketolase